MNLLAHAPSRRAFLGLWGGWTVVALLAAALDAWFLEAGRAVGLVIGILALISFTGMEFNFRRNNLPWKARRPWHAILVLFVLIIPILVVTVGPQYDYYLPGSVSRRENCQLRIKRLSAIERNLDIIFKSEWEKSNWGPMVRTKDFSETLIWMRGEDAHWIIYSDLSRARSLDQSEQEIILSPAGYEEFVRQLIRDPIPPEQIERAAGILLDVMSRRSSISRTISGPQFMFDCDSDPVPSSRPWLWIAAILFSVCLFPVSWIVVGSTMFPQALRE